MKIVEIRKLDTKDLAKKANDLKEEIANMRHQVSLGEVQNVRGIKNKRKDLARVLTVLSEQLIKETK